MDMTTGKPVNLLLRFSIPLVLGNVFQQLYTFADTLIVGQKLGMYALAALGSTEWLSFLMFGLIQGMTQGFSVSVSKYYGERARKLFFQSIFGAFLASAGAALFFTLIGQVMLYPALKLLRTPDALLQMAYDYLKILYIGIPISFAYNILAAVLRAVGNSKAPLRAMMIASFGNIALDILFVMYMGAGIKGAAFGTVIAQLFAAVYCGMKLREMLCLKEACSDKIWLEWTPPEKTGTKTAQSEMTFYQMIAEQLKLGIPMGVQNVMTACGGLVVQSVVNGFGILFLAGYTAANKLYALLEIAASSYGYGISTYTAQNMGARKKERIRTGLAAALGIGTLTAYLMSLIMVVFGKRILALFITDTQVEIGQAIGIGYQFLCILAVFFPLLYGLYIIRSCIQGMGNSVMPMLSSLLQVFMRIFCAVVVTRWIGTSGVFWGEIMAWTMADFYLLFVFFYQYRRVSLEQQLFTNKDL